MLRSIAAEDATQVGGLPEHQATERGLQQNQVGSPTPPPPTPPHHIRVPWGMGASACPALRHQPGSQGGSTALKPGCLVGGWWVTRWTDEYMPTCVHL